MRLRPQATLKPSRRGDPMTIRAKQATIEDVEAHIGLDGAIVRIPCMESATDYFRLEEQLSSEFRRRPATNWIIDLCEHADGITLVLAGVLAGLGEKARRSGCTIKCTGLQGPCAKCGAKCGEAPPTAVRTVKESWMGMAEEPSRLHG